MRKPDEDLLIQLIMNNPEGMRVPDDYWALLTKRQYYILDKWTRKGWWEYGVSLRSGWMTQEGIIALTDDFDVKL